MKKTLYILLIILSINFVTTEIQARPGGGNSFSYDSDDDDDYSSYDDDDDDYWNDDDDDDFGDDADFWDDDDDDDDYTSSGSSEGGGMFVVLFVGIFFMAAIVQLSKEAIRRKKAISSYKSTVKSKPLTPVNVDKKTPIPAQKFGMKYVYEVDENFSKVLFSEFVNLLLVRYYSNIGKENFKNIRPFISNYLQIHADEYVKKYKITKDDSVKIEEIVIGAINFIYTTVAEDFTTITASIDFNFSLKNKDIKTRHVLTEEWIFERATSVKTKPPKDGIYELVCPNCGAPANFTDINVCNSCGERIYSRKFDWYVSNKKTKYHNVLKQTDLFYYAPEKGTSRKTFVHYKFVDNLKLFAKNHDITNLTTFKTKFTDNIVKPVFLEMYHAWSELKWEKVRHLLTDRLWESNLFWIDAYKHYKVVNKLDKIFINEIEFANLEIDKFYEAITVRVFASCIDYVQNIATGKVIAGNNKNYTVFSEYWTFIRRTGIEKSVDTIDVHKCPNCGANADKMGQSAVCEYCNTKISTGEFSWILSAIIQDDVYRG